MLSGIDLAVLALVAAGAALAAGSIYRARKKGGCAGCSGCCPGCGERTETQKQCETE